MTELEAELRTWMQDRAARVHASRRLLSADYRPRTRRARSPLAIGGGLTSAAAALAATLSLAGGASPAFAGWTPQPTVATPAQLAAAEAYCAANIPTPGLPLVLSDSRGPFTFAVYSNGASDDFCTVGPSFRNASGWTSSQPVSPPAGQLFLWTDHSATVGGQPYGFMIARAGAGLSAADLTLDDGSTVTATVENGWAVAWWPGTQHVASAQLSTPSGIQTQTFPAYPCDVHNCNGSGAHGAAPGGSPGGG